MTGKISVYMASAAVVVGAAVLPVVMQWALTERCCYNMLFWPSDLINDAMERIKGQYSTVQLQVNLIREKQELFW